MAKLITLNLGGVPVYPNTVTDAIADVASRKRLSDIIAELQSKPAGDSYSIVKDSESDLIYRLMKNGTEVAGEINIAVDTFLDSAAMDGDELVLTFNTQSNKSAVRVDLSKYIDAYYAGNGLNLDANKKFSIKVVGNYLSVNEDGLSVVTGTVDEGADKLAVASDVKTAIATAKAGAESASKTYADAQDASVLVAAKAYADNAVAAVDHSAVVAEANAYTDNAVSAEDVAIKAWVNGVLEGAVYAEVAGDQEYLDITAILGTTVSTPATFAAVLNKGTEAKAVLVEDVDLVEPITITPKMSATADGDAAQYTITVDLNGKKVTCASGDAFVNMDPNAKLVIKNGEIEAKNAIAHAEGGKVVVESGTYKSTSNAPLTVGDNGAIVVNGGSFVGPEGAVITGYAQGADIEINGGTFAATDNLVLAGNGNNKNSAGVVRTEANHITVNGGTFNGAIKSSGYIAGGIYAPWKDVWTLNGGVFNVTNGCGICARAGQVTIGENVVFNVTGTTSGWVGDKKTSVPCAAIVYDESANYPAQDETSKITVNSAVIANSTVSEGQDKVVVMKTEGNVAEADGVRVVVAE